MARIVMRMITMQTPRSSFELWLMPWLCCCCGGCGFGGCLASPDVTEGDPFSTLSESGILWASNLSFVKHNSHIFSLGPSPLDWREIHSTRSSFPSHVNGTTGKVRPTCSWGRATGGVAKAAHAASDGGLFRSFVDTCLIKVPCIVHSVQRAAMPSNKAD